MACLSAFIRYLSIALAQFPTTMVEYPILRQSLFVGFHSRDNELDGSWQRIMGTSSSCWHSFDSRGSWCVGILYSLFLHLHLASLPVQETDQLTPAPSLNASSLSLSYNAPPTNTTLTSSLQNSRYVYGNCENATALSTAYITSSYHNTIIVSTIAPSATCCTKCEIGADRVCYEVTKHAQGEKGSEVSVGQTSC